MGVLPVWFLVAIPAKRLPMGNITDATGLALHKLIATNATIDRRSI